MSDITLYFDLLSQPSRAVYLFLKAAKIPFKENNMDLMKEEHKKPEYLQINPAGQVPAVKVGDFCLTESAAILKYLASLKGKKDWNGKTVEYEARIDQYLSWQQSGMRKPCIEVFIPTLINKITFGLFIQKNIDPKQAEDAKKALEVAICQFEDRYLKSLTDKKTKIKFIGGSHISVADILAYCELYQLSAVGKEGFYKKSPAVKQWMADVEKEIENGGGKGTLEKANKRLCEVKEKFAAADGAKK
ncbi:Glutathione S-transferase theta-1 [Mactra antiquata]